MFTQVSGASGPGFAILTVLGNAIAVPAGLPAPATAYPDGAEFFASGSAALDVAAALGPLTWTLATIFGAGAVTVLRSGWAIAGLGGLLLQNGTFAAIVALRLALASPSEGLWVSHEALFRPNGTFVRSRCSGCPWPACRPG